MGIEIWMPAVKAKWAEIEGIVQVHTYDDLPASIQVVPCAILLLSGGSYDYSAGGPSLAFHELRAIVFVSLQILPEAMAVAVPFIERVRNKMAANWRLGGIVEHIVPAPGGRFYEGPGRVTYGDKEHLGIVFHFEVKQNETGTYTVSP